MEELTFRIHGIECILVSIVEVRVHHLHLVVLERTRRLLKFQFGVVLGARRELVGANNQHMEQHFHHKPCSNE